MVTPNLHTIAKELNERARKHPIGKLQKIRSGQDHPITGQDIFRLTSKTVHDNWACHYGGRPELQFNIGLEEGGRKLRHGVAFSLETSRQYPDIVELLRPKIQLFNDFMLLCPMLFSDMEMWYYDHHRRSLDYIPEPVPSHLVRKQVFIFIGKRQPINRINYEVILCDFNRLLPVYEYVESHGTKRPDLSSSSDELGFRPGCTAKASSATGTQAGKQVSFCLRHNDLQTAFHQQLVSKYGAKNVGTENTFVPGTSIDVVVRNKDAYWFYEIKASRFPRACLREAIGQLLEYAFWPGAPAVERLIVVGESPLDKDAADYLCSLKKRFSLPIEYEQITVGGEGRRQVTKSPNSCDERRIDVR